jgi:hypothetical protein
VHGVDRVESTNVKLDVASAACDDWAAAGVWATPKKGAVKPSNKSKTLPRRTPTR